MKHTATVTVDGKTVTATTHTEDSYTALFAAARRLRLPAVMLTTSAIDGGEYVEFLDGRGRLVGSGRYSLDTTY